MTAPSDGAAATNFSAEAELQAALLIEVPLININAGLTFDRHGNGTARQKGEHMPRPTRSQTGLEPKTCATQAHAWSKHG